MSGSSEARTVYIRAGGLISRDPPRFRGRDKQTELQTQGSFTFKTFRPWTVLHIYMHAKHIPPISR